MFLLCDSWPLCLLWSALGCECQARSWLSALPICPTLLKGGSSASTLNLRFSLSSLTHCITNSFSCSTSFSWVPTLFQVHLGEMDPCSPGNWRYNEEEKQAATKESEVNMWSLLLLLSAQGALLTYDKGFLILAVSHQGSNHQANYHWLFWKDASRGWNPWQSAPGGVRRMTALSWITAWCFRLLKSTLTQMSAAPRLLRSDYHPHPTPLGNAWLCSGGWL